MCSNVPETARQVAVNIHLDPRARLDCQAVIKEIQAAVDRNQVVVLEFTSAREGVIDLVFQIEDAFERSAVSVLVI